MKIDLSYDELLAAFRTLLPYIQNVGRVDELRTVREEDKDRIIQLEHEVKHLRTHLQKAQTHPVEMGSGSIMNSWAPVFAALATNSKIQAIKLVKDMMQCGLKDAKDLVEGVYRET